jgi:hypothetical protein
MHVVEKTNDFGQDASSEEVQFNVNVLGSGTPKQTDDDTRQGTLEEFGFVKLLKMKPFNLIL